MSRLCASKWDFLIHAMLSVSTVFAVRRCLSVRLSVTLVYCIQMAEDIEKTSFSTR